MTTVAHDQNGAILQQCGRVTTPTDKRRARLGPYSSRGVIQLGKGLATTGLTTGPKITASDQYLAIRQQRCGMTIARKIHKAR
jgi:hypothetical protein